MIVCSNCRVSPRPCHWHFLLDWKGQDDPPFGTLRANDPQSWAVIENSDNPTHSYIPDSFEELPRTFEKNKKYHFCVYRLEYFVFRYGRSEVNAKSYDSRRNESRSVMNQLQERYSSELTAGLCGGIGKHLTSHAANSQIKTRRQYDEMGVPEHIKDLDGLKFYREVEKGNFTLK